MRRARALLLTSLAGALLSVGCSSTSVDGIQPPTTTTTLEQDLATPHDPAALASGDASRALGLSRCGLNGMPVERAQRLPAATDPSPASGCVDLVLPAWPHADPFSPPE